jgi:hypothetical protein
MKIVNIYKEKFDVYIGRAGKGNDGYFGNPYVVGKTCQDCGNLHIDGEATLPCYEIYLRKRIKEPEFLQKFLLLKGKTLGCFCKPKPCHGDIMIKLLKELGGE